MLLRKLGIGFLLCIVLGCAPETPQSYLQSQNTDSWQWPKDFQRELKMAKSFHANAIKEVAFQKNARGRYLHTSINQLLKTNLFKPLDSNTQDMYLVDSVYMQESRALFDTDASYKFPRQLTTVGTTTLGLYTNPAHHDSYNALEMIEMNPHTAEIDFYFLSFENGKPEFEKNPPSCIGCHGGKEDRRHIWQIYNRWPGMMIDRLPERFPRRLGSRSEIGFTMNLYEINMARIAKKLLLDTDFTFQEQRLLIASVLDCDKSLFPFDQSEISNRIKKRKSEYYKDLAYLIDDLNATGPDSEAYDYNDEGEVDGTVVINRKDPTRIALMDLVLEGTQANIDEWSVSRDPGTSSLLFQASGGLSLNRLAFYIAANSNHHEEILTLVPNIEKLSYGAYPKTELATCERLIP